MRWHYKPDARRKPLLTLASHPLSVAKTASARGWLLSLLTASCLLAPHAAQAGSLFVSLEPGQLCRAAITSAARAFAIPSGLLEAIGRVESGRRDPTNGAFLPWPWTVDADGSGSFYATKAEAIAAVKKDQAAGIRSIDVGCMQINLLHHPDAFASLEQAFDPASNAAYAARFLRKLHGETGNWPQAAAFYHSTTPEIADPYERRVMAAWPAGLREAAGVGPPLPVVFAGGPRTASPMSPTNGPFPPRRYGAFMLVHRPIGAAPARPLVFGPPTLSGRTLSSYRRMPVLIASEALHGR